MRPSVPYSIVPIKTSIHAPVMMRPVGNTPSVRPGIVNGVGSPWAAATILAAGLLRRFWGSVKLPELLVKRPATKEVSLTESRVMGFVKDAAL